MKIRLSELPVGSCFLQGRSTRKKLEGERTASVSSKGRVKMKKIKGDPEVDPIPCPLKYLGVGLRRHPDLVVEIGDGNIQKGRRRP